jgi:hypothetical protein
MNLMNFKELHNPCKDFGIYTIQINITTYGCSCDLFHILWPLWLTSEPLA